MESNKAKHIASLILRGIAAIILLQTLFFKFTGAAESVYIFSTLGAEPWGRIASGVIELVASMLLVLPRTAVFGAALSLVTITGAILSHLTKLGVALPAVGDRGELFALAIVVFVCSAAVLLLHRHELPLLSRSSDSSRAQ
jgi:putative oxidoreductase